MRQIKLTVQYNYGDIVYVITDPDQNRWIINGYRITDGDRVEYFCASGMTGEYFYDFELSTEKFIQ